MKKQYVTLSDNDRTYLENLISKGRLPAKMYKRSEALLELDRGSTFTNVARIVGVTIQTASTWAEKYGENGLEFLTDKPRSGRPKEIDGTTCAQITALACSDAPEGHSQWSLRLLAEKVVELEYIDTISHTEIGRILKKTNSSPI
ncbi:MAG: helix-turn-helix domain-containing protein [Chloroflexi bacterium]|nr:helix-turn-helix domain-containing protein [Chloroflexota bacterium]